MLKKMIPALLKHYYKKHPFLVWIIPVDANTDIHLFSEEWIEGKRHRFGVKEEIFDDQDNE